MPKSRKGHELFYDDSPNFPFKATRDGSAPGNSSPARTDRQLEGYYSMRRRVFPGSSMDRSWGHNVESHTPAPAPERHELHDFEAMDKHRRPADKPVAYTMVPEEWIPRKTAPPVSARQTTSVERTNWDIDYSRNFSEYPPSRMPAGHYAEVMQSYQYWPGSRREDPAREAALGTLRTEDLEAGRFINYRPQQDIRGSKYSTSYEVSSFSRPFDGLDTFPGSRNTYSGFEARQAPPCFDSSEKHQSIEIKHGWRSFNGSARTGWDREPCGLGNAIRQPGKGGPFRSDEAPRSAVGQELCSMSPVDSRLSRRENLAERYIDFESWAAEARVGMKRPQFISGHITERHPIAAKVQKDARLSKGNNHRFYSANSGSSYIHAESGTNHSYPPHNDQITQSPPKHAGPLSPHGSQGLSVARNQDLCYTTSSYGAGTSARSRDDPGGTDVYDPLLPGSYSLLPTKSETTSHWSYFQQSREDNVRYKFANTFSSMAAHQDYVRNVPNASQPWQPADFDHDVDPVAAQRLSPGNVPNPTSYGSHKSIALCRKSAYYAMCALQIFSNPGCAKADRLEYYINRCLQWAVSAGSSAKSAMESFHQSNE